MKMKGKRILSFAMAALLIFACAGTATAEVIEIANAGQLAAFRDRVNSGETSLDAKLTADITLTGNWVPIGTHIIEGASEPYTLSKDYSYNGNFDGNGMTVSGLRVTLGDAASYLFDGYDHDRAGGLFGVTSSDAVIENLTIKDAEILLSDTGGYSGTGAFVGYHFGSLLNCTAQGGTIAGTWDAGGVVGSNNGTITNCTAGGIESIIGSDYAGGVAGDNYGNITNCSASEIENIEGDYAGGVVGRNYGKVSSCTASDLGVKGSEDAGALVGFHWYGDADTILENSAAVGVTVTGSGTDYEIYVGGLVGYSSAPVRGCVVYGAATRSVSAETIGGTAYVGGALGYFYHDYSAAIANCRYPAGIVDTDGIYSDPEGWAIGNLPETSHDLYGISNVRPYDPETSPDQLETIVVLFDEDESSVTVGVGSSRFVDLVRLPGASGDLTIAVNSLSPGVAAAEPTADGTQVKLTGVSPGTAQVEVTLSGDMVDARLVCYVTVVEAMTITPGTLSLQVGEPFDQTCALTLPAGATYWNRLTQDMDFDDEELGITVTQDLFGSTVQIAGTPAAAGTYCIYVTGAADSGEKQVGMITLNIAGPTHGSGSSNCNSGVGAALFALLGLAFVMKKK